MGDIVHGNTKKLTKSMSKLSWSKSWLYYHKRWSL